MLISINKTKNEIVNKELKENELFSFDKTNYVSLIVGVVIIILGFVMMSGGGSEDPNVFTEDIFSARRITFAPLTVIIGYVVLIYAIMRKA